MLSDDVYRSRLQVMAASLKYWVPSIADAARPHEAETANFWKLHVVPSVLGACPFELIFRADQHYDVQIAEQSYENLPVESFDLFLPFVQAIADGRIIERRWSSRMTGRQLGVETIIPLPKGGRWRQAHLPDGGVESLMASDDAVFTDHHFLPYKR